MIGSGQEIHIGEEAGLGQWRKAIEGAREPTRWLVHGPPTAAHVFEASLVSFTPNTSLSLDTEIRFHAAEDLHHFVGSVLEGQSAERSREFITLATRKT